MCKIDNLDEALQAADLLHKEGIQISWETFLCLLKACTRKKDLAAGRRVYSLMVSNKLDSVAILGDHLIRLFASCESLQEANLVFSKIAKPSVYTWHAIISACVMHGEDYMALKLYHKMQQEGIAPDKFMYTCILKVCSNLGAIGQGRVIHDQIIRSGLEADTFIGSTLVDMYAKCDGLEEACNVFSELSNKNVVSWNVMIARSVQHGHGLLAIELYEKMQEEGIVPNTITFSSILKACGSIGAMYKGKLIHKQIIRCGLASDVFIGSTLVDMYAKCGNMEEACKAFEKMPNRNVVSWCTMIAGYAQHGNGLTAIKLYEKMQLEGIKPDKVTFSCILKACGSLGDVGWGRLIHEDIVSNGLESDTVIGNSLVSMYGKCGNLEEAWEVFDNLPTRNVISWAAMIAGYAHQGHGLPALRLFEKMQQEDVKPDKVTFIVILEACGSIGALGQGKLIHNQIIRSGLESDVVIGSTLINMYSKCGSLEEACYVFNGLQNQNVISWGAMIAGYGRHGNWILAGQCLKDMQQQGLRPDGMIYTSILAACCHAGHAEEGYQYFKAMKGDHGIIPSIEHFGCMIDLLGRAGHMLEAEELLDIMPIPPDITGWVSLLAACRRYSNVELGKQCFNHIMQLDPNFAAGYVLMSNIYANAQMWEDLRKLQERRKGAAAWKKPGRAWIEVNEKVHEFSVGDKSHTQSDEIYAKLQSLKSLMEEEGYRPEVGLVPETMSNKGKDDVLCGHCERLAIGFGLLTMPEGTTIRVTKNLRVCMDCHSATKIISKIERRPVTIIDAYRVHQFKDGVCSCGDWY